MNWRSEWSGLSARIRGAVEAAEVYFQARGSSSDEYNTVRNCLLPLTGEIYSAVKRFAQACSDNFPPNAVECITRFLQTRDDVFASSNSLLPNAAIQFRVTALAAFRSEFDHHIADSAMFSRRMSDRAFVHIQRSIVVDDDERARWTAAFSKGETSCERLGSIRLLSHGIWAFKVDAVGERTDLVFQEPLQNTADLQRSADALVLTEWKLCPRQADLASKLMEARTQAQRYRAGALAAIELMSYRYLVMVSSKHLVLPRDELVDGVLYRHINVAVDPNTPSTDSREARLSK